MRCHVFLDLDDTLFQTRPKCPPGVELSPTAYRRDDTPLSFMTPQQVHLLQLLSAEADIIPVTARNLDAFRRVRLTFSSLAVLDFGGVILLPDGTSDPGWDARIRPQARAIADDLNHWRHTLQSFVEAHQLGVSVRVIADLDMPLYVVLKHPHGDVGALERIHREVLAGLDRSRFFVHFNDNNLSLVPRFLGKEQAVRYILEHHLKNEPRLTIGVADSDTDAGFLALCDFALLPRHSQLARRLLDRMCSD